MQYNARISKIRTITDDIRLFTILLDGGRRLPFAAGQFAVLSLPLDFENTEGEWLRRAYSISSAPSREGGELEFYVVLVSDGREKSSEDGGPNDRRLTSHLFRLKEGDGIHVGEKAGGGMAFAHVSEDADLLFMATGTGIAPFASIFREHKAEIFNGRRQVALAHGARHTYELGFKGEMEELARLSPYFRYYPVVSRSHQEEGIEWKGQKGHVQQLITDGILEQGFGKKITPARFCVFLCGLPKMVDESAQIFTDMGFKRHTPSEPGNLFLDKH